MDLARGFWPQVHDQVGAAQRKPPGARTGGGDLITVVVAQGSFQAEDQFNATGQHTAATFQVGYDGVDGGNLLRSFGAAHHDAVKPGPHGGAEIREHQLGVDLDKHLRAVGLCSGQVLMQRLTSRGFVGFGHELGEIQGDHVRARRRGI